MLRIFYLATFAALVMAQPDQNIQSRIVGGEGARANTWPWQASLQVVSGSRNDHVCGGVLIKKQWVLTAARCLDGVNVSRVVLGEHDLTKNEGTEQVIKVKRTYIHPNWDKANGNDIALILLAENAVLNSYVKTATLPPSDQIPSNRWTCYVTGWGYVENNGPNSNVLRQATQSIKDISTCRSNYYWSPEKIKDSMICADGFYRYGCNGDFGGPLSCMVDVGYVVHGLTSFVSDEGCNKKPTVFTRVSAFIPWVQCITG